MTSKLTESVGSEPVAEPSSGRSWLKKIRRWCGWLWWPAAALAFGWTVVATTIGTTPLLAALEPLAATLMVLVVFPVGMLYTFVYIIDTAFGVGDER